MNATWFIVLVSLAPFGSTDDKVLSNGFLSQDSCLRMAVAAQAQVIQMKADKEFTVMCRKLSNV